MRPRAPAVSKVCAERSQAAHLLSTRRPLAGIEIELSKRYGAMLNITFVILTYASGIPIMYFFGIMFYVTAYWCDKICLLRACRKPAQYDEKLAMLTTNLMSVGMAVHLLFGAYFFGYPDAEIFPIPFLSGPQVPELIRQKVNRAPAAFVFFFFMVFVVTEVSGRTFAPPLFRAIWARFHQGEEEIKEGNPSSFEALENQEISGLDTYNIKKNPRYRDAFSSEIVEVEEDDDSDESEVDDFGMDDDSD